MIRYMKDILSGERTMTDNIRFEIARIGIGCVHILLLLQFIYIQCYPLVIFNIISILFYIFVLEYIIRKQHYTLALISTYLEVVIHSFFACFMLGWDLGFSLYNIGLLYVAYYFSYISPTIRKKILTPSILGFINLFFMLMMRMYTYAFGPAFTDYSPRFTVVISTINLLVAIVMIMFFAILHSVEIRKKEYELRTINRNLNQLAHYDALTHLRNRHSMEEALHSILESTDHEYCFVMGDVDNFKRINDNYGHACGDYILKNISEIITNNLDKKHIACRWGGEEILILLHGNVEYAKIITEKIRYEIENMEAVYQDQHVDVTITFGIAPYNPADSFEKCISRADKLMYKGKQTGKNRIITR